MARSTSASIQARKPRSSRSAVQTDGKILAGGLLQVAGRRRRTRPAQVRCVTTSGGSTLTASSTATFDPGANNVVNAVALQADGAIVVGGIFDRLGNGNSLAPGVGTLRNRDRADHEHRGGSDPDHQRRWHGRDLAAKRRRAGSLACDVRILVRRLVLLVARERLRASAGGWQLTSVNLPVHFRTV